MKQDNDNGNPLHLPLLICGLISSQAAAYAVTSSMGDRTFSLLVHLSVLISYVVAYYSLQNRLPVNLLTVGTLVISLIGFVSVHSGVRSAEIMYPNAGISDPQLALANLLVWFLVGFGFSQGRRRQMVFVSATGVALFGLIGVINLEIGFLVAFAVFLFATILAWSHDGLVNRAGRWKPMDWRRVMAAQAVSAMPVLAGAALAGFIVGSLLFAAVPNPFGRNLAFRSIVNWGGVFVQGNFAPLRRLAVGAGPARLGEEVLFLLSAEHPGLWRSGAYDYYDGHHWTRAQSGSWPAERGTEPNTFVLPPPEGPPRQFNRQVFTVERGTSGLVLGAAKPVEVRVLQDGQAVGASSLWYDQYGSLQLSPIRPRYSRYEVISAMVEWQPGDLRRASRSISPWMRHYYIDNVPLAVEMALSSLVTEITAGAGNNYDKAVAIQTYLEENYLYTEQEPVTPLDEDAVVYFLLKTRRGACDVFASAMAMMLRMAGVPCRLASGFLSGPVDPETGKTLIRSRDAHAWVEVYFPGYDWIPFNPTPPRGPEKVSLWALLRQGQFWYATGQLLQRIGLVLLALTGLALFFFAVADPRLLRTRWVNFRQSRDPWERAARECQRATAQAVTCTGLPPLKGETPLEMLERVTAAPPSVLPQHMDRLRGLTRELYAARFGPTTAPPETPLRLSRELRRVRKRLRCRRRRKG